MFWIGLIVGIVLCVVLYYVAYLYVTHDICSSPDEYWDCIRAIYEATQNRESIITVGHNGEVIYDVALLER